MQPSRNPVETQPEGGARGPVQKPPRQPRRTCGNGHLRTLASNFPRRKSFSGRNQTPRHQDSQPHSVYACGFFCQVKPLANIVKKQHGGIYRLNPKRETDTKESTPPRAEVRPIKGLTSGGNGKPRQPCLSKQKQSGCCFLNKCIGFGQKPCLSITLSKVDIIARHDQEPKWVIPMTTLSL